MDAPLYLQILEKTLILSIPPKQPNSSSRIIRWSGGRFQQNHQTVTQLRIFGTSLRVVRTNSLFISTVANLVAMDLLYISQSTAATSKQFAAFLHLLDLYKHKKP